MANKMKSGWAIILQSGLIRWKANNSWALCDSYCSYCFLVESSMCTTFSFLLSFEFDVTMKDRRVERYLFFIFFHMFMCIRWSLIIGFIMILSNASQKQKLLLLSVAWSVYVYVFLSLLLYLFHSRGKARSLLMMKQDEKSRRRKKRFWSCEYNALFLILSLLLFILSLLCYYYQERWVSLLISRTLPRPRPTPFPIPPTPLRQGHRFSLQFSSISIYSNRKEEKFILRGKAKKIGEKTTGDRVWTAISSSNGPQNKTHKSRKRRSSNTIKPSLFFRFFYFVFGFPANR